jgi:hypothetical protein
MNDVDVMDCTVAEWQAELERVTAKIDAPGLTAEQLQAAWKVSPNTCRKRLHALAARGLISVGRIYRIDLAGRNIPIPVYDIRHEVTPCVRGKSARPHAGGPKS